MKRLLPRSRKDLSEMGKRTEAKVHCALRGGEGSSHLLELAFATFMSFLAHFRALERVSQIVFVSPKVQSYPFCPNYPPWSIGSIQVPFFTDQSIFSDNLKKRRERGKSFDGLDKIPPFPKNWGWRGGRERKLSTLFSRFSAGL